MGDIRETFMKKYGWGEYLLFILGATVLGYQVYSYVTNSLEGSALDGVAFVCGVFCVLAPMTLLDFARKKVGMETKSNK